MWKSLPYLHWSLGWGWIREWHHNDREDGLQSTKLNWPYRISGFSSFCLGGWMEKSTVLSRSWNSRSLFLTFHSYYMKPIYFSGWFISRDDCNKSHCNSSSFVALMILNETVCGVELCKLFFLRLRHRTLQITLSAPLSHKNVMLSYTYGLSETVCWCYLGLKILKTKPSYCNTAVLPFLGKLDSFCHSLLIQSNTHNAEVYWVVNGCVYLIHIQHSKLVGYNNLIISML